MRSSANGVTSIFWGEKKILCSIKIVNFKASPLECTPTGLLIFATVRRSVGEGLWYGEVGVCVRVCALM